MVALGRLEQVNLRQIWPNEAADFTQWLAKSENIDLLAEAVLGAGSLTVLETESSVGRYRVDILATDSEDRVVVIENQLGQTDHDHLGKILTYAAGKQAEVIVWIAREAREEHENAVNWLNEHSDGNINIFLIQVEAWRIGDSDPAPRFNIIAKPNDWLKVVKQSTTAGTQSDLKLQQQEFFDEMRDLGPEIAPNVKSWPKAIPQHWYDIRLGTSKGQISITLNSQKRYVGVELYANNKETYYSLEAKKEEIEAALGLQADWQEQPSKVASRIMVKMDGDFRDPSERAALREWALLTANKFASVFPRYL